MNSTRPITILIAALGGEGGGVLTGWIVSAAEAAGFPVQSTSIPGVAQRTGATTYYIEIFPEQASELSGKRPVLALTPGIGDIDVVVASELLEAGRTVLNGFVTPDRTHVIASLSRFFTMDEKIAMGDGRYDDGKLVKLITDSARDVLLFDMTRLGNDNGAMVNAVMLGAIAGSGRLPISTGQYLSAIGGAGKAGEANRRGFQAGLDAAHERAEAGKAAAGKRNAAPTLASLEQQAAAAYSGSAQPIVIEGVRRLVPYQGIAYAQLFLDRLKPVAEADRQSGAQGSLLKEVARHLAVRMSYEDVVRVAQEKISPERMARIAREELRAKGEPYSVHDFLKPGIEELCQLLPSAAARPILSLAARKGWLGRFHLGMEINSTSITGYLRFLILAKLRAVRPYGHRYAQEQAQIESWLRLIGAAAERSSALGLEVAECARLIKGYGDTLARGLANYRRIEEALLRPAIAGGIPLDRAVDAIASARTAALIDPDGESLAKCLVESGVVAEAA